MYIRELHIENVRGFDDVRLDLTRPDGSFAGWTVIAGRNGSGKTTLLRAIALSVAGPTMAEKLLRSYAGWIREGQHEATISTHLDSSVRDWIGGDHTDRVPFWTALQWSRTSGPEPSVRVPLSMKILQPQLPDERGPWDANPRGWFLAGYGPFRRIGYREDYQKPGPQMAATLATLFDEDATLAEAVHWLKDLHAYRLDLLERAQKNYNTGDPLLRNGAEFMETDARKMGEFMTALVALLDDGLLPPGSKIASLDMRGLIVEQSRVALPLPSLSDGYRAAIALVFDIVRQMDRCFGPIVIDATKKPVVVPCEGTVLIDEVDAHLHIEWQKRIGFWLKEHFPNIQFIVTTHSPFICQAADPRGLIRLPAPGSGEKAAHVSDEDFKVIVNGGADDAAFTALFGIGHTHSERAEKRKMRVAELEAKVIRGTSTPEERTELERLLAELPDTGSALVERLVRKTEALR